MGRVFARGLALSLAVWSLSSAVLCQETQRKAPLPAMPKSDCEPDNCVSKILNLPDFPTAFELQEVTNIVRTIADIRYIYPKQADHTIALKGTPEQLAITDRLVSALQTIRSSGGHDRSSVLIYELKGLVPDSTVSEDTPGQCFFAGSRAPCELKNSYIRVLYLPDFSTTQMQDLINGIRTTAQVTRIVPAPSSHAIVFKGTAEQVAIAEKLPAE